MELFKVCPVFSIIWIVCLKPLPKRCEHRSEQCVVLSRTNLVCGFVTQVEREKEPTDELFSSPFFKCSGATASRKTECISTKMRMGGVYKYNNKCFPERQWKYDTENELFWLSREINIHQRPLHKHMWALLKHPSEATEWFSHQQKKQN